MTIEGLFSSLFRAIKKWLSKIPRLFKREKNKAEPEPEIPAAWKKRNRRQARGSGDPGVGVPLEKSSTRKVYRFPLIRTIKRFLAGILLFINFVISQFLLASGSQAAPAFILFLLNSLILLDYLWKTRSKEG